MPEKRLRKVVSIRGFVIKKLLFFSQTRSPEKSYTQNCSPNSGLQIIINIQVNILVKCKDLFFCEDMYILADLFSSSSFV